jgi:hypothetical protein
MWLPKHCEKSIKIVEKSRLKKSIKKVEKSWKKLKKVEKSRLNEVK